MKLKTCTKCGEPKEEVEFYKNGVRCSSKCKLCTCEEGRDSRKLNYTPSENDTLRLENKRRCSCCQCIKSLDDFYIKRKSHEGWCKVCKGVKKRKHYSDNPHIPAAKAAKAKEKSLNDPETRQRLKTYSAAYYQANKEKHDKWVSDWYKDHPEKRLEMHNKWRLANLHKCRIYSNKRRAAKLNAIPLWADEEWEAFFEQEIYNLAKLCEESFSEKFQVDHIIPLQSDNVCGLHVSNNLQLLTKSENIIKGNRHWPDMW